jgi:hypothetical protein
VLFVLFSPLVIIEVLILWQCECKLLPLSWFLNGNPFKGFKNFDRSILPKQPEVPSDLESTSVKVVKEGKTFYKFDAKTIGAAAMAEKSCHIMLATTTVETTRDIPEHVQGIFWMDGNGLPEILVSMNYGVWDPEKLILTKVTCNFDWSYLDSVGGTKLAVSQTPSTPSGMMPTTFKTDELADGRIWICYSDAYTELSWLSMIGEFTIEQLHKEDTARGVEFKRGIYWFPAIFGRKFERGSYKLRKIMHTDRTKVQPAYDDFLKWMETVNKGCSLLMPGPASKQPGSSTNAENVENAKQQALE